MDVLNKLMFFSSHVIVLQSSDLLERWSWGSRLSSSSVSSSFSSDQSQSSSAAGSPAPPARTHAHALTLFHDDATNRKKAAGLWMNEGKRGRGVGPSSVWRSWTSCPRSVPLPSSERQTAAASSPDAASPACYDWDAAHKQKQEINRVCSHHAGWLGISMNEPQQFTLLNVSIYS